MSNKTNNRQAGRLVYQFGDFCLDVDRGLLCRAGAVVPLRPKTWDVLAHLVKHHGELVGRADLIDEVWHHSDVSDDSLTQCIVEIRRAIGDADRTKVRTVPRRGFIFELPVNRVFPEDDGAVEPASPAKRWALAVALPLLLVLGLFSLWLKPGPDEAPSVGPANPLPSVAVLAFADMTDAQDRQYFADGVAEEILNQLALAPELRVISRSSSFTFRGEDHDISEIADALDVDFVLEGSVRGNGTTLRITAQLIDADSDSHLWAESFDHDVTVASAIDIQSDVAMSVAAAIGVHLGLPITVPGHEPLEVSPVAEERYLRGMYYFRKITTIMGSASDYEVAASHFRAAIDVEPEWAAPYAALGATLHFRATGSFIAEEDIGAAFEESRRHLDEAVRLDPELSAAYQSLAFVAHTWELDFERADALYDKAIALGGHPHWGYAIMLRALGRYEEAVEQYRKALLESPLSVGIKMQLANSLRCIGRYAESQTHVEALLEAHPGDTGIESFRSFLLARQGDLAGARAAVEPYRNSEAAWEFAETLALLGMAAEAEARLDELDRHDGRWVPEHYTRLAVILGQEERALGYLETVLADHPQRIAGMRCPDDIGPLQADPRFTAILARAGLPVSVATTRR